MFWPRFAANVSVLALSYGAFVLGFRISFWQGLAVSVVGIVLSSVLCGFIAALPGAPQRIVNDRLMRATTLPPVQGRALRRIARRRSRTVLWPDSCHLVIYFWRCGCGLGVLGCRGAEMVTNDALAARVV